MKKYFIVNVDTGEVVFENFSVLFTSWKVDELVEKNPDIRLRMDIREV